MSLLKAGVVGAGVFGRHHARKLLSDPRIEFVGVYDPHPERAKAVAEEMGARDFATLDALLERVDLLTVASPAATHAGAANVALAAGKHVLVEKPLAVDPVDGAALIELAARNHLVLACGHQERLVFEAIGLLSAPEKPLRVASIRNGLWTGRCIDVSVTLDLMVHDLDLALALFGAQPEWIDAEGRAEKVASADSVNAELRFHDSVAAFCASRIATERKRTMHIIYPSGEVKIDFLARTFENKAGFALNADFAETPAGRDPLGANVVRFIDAVTGAAPRPAVTGAEGLAVLKLALAVDRAAGLPSLS